MIKPDDIKKHTAEFFTSDPDFVLWCLDPERAQDGYWCGYTERHPQDLVEFERAVSLVRRVGKTHPALPSVEKQLLLDRILTDHYARRRLAAPPRRRNRTALFAAASLLVAGVVAALFWSADFTGSGLPSAEAYENITLVTREGSREVYDDIARISLTPKGEILIDGENIYARQTEVVELRKKVGMVFQSPDNQIVATVVEEDVAFALENLGVPPEEMRRRVDDAMKMAGNYEFRERAPHNLSGGQKQRVAIAGVVAMRPDCLILDEATAMLDPRGREQVMQTIHHLNKNMGITVVSITHYMEEAAQADRVLVMSKGHVVMEGTPKEVFSQTEKVRSLHLDVPQAAELRDELVKAGIPMPEGIIDTGECAQALYELLQ